MNMKQKSIFTLTFILPVIFSAFAMQDNPLSKRALPDETTSQAKVSASATAQFERKIHSEKITLPLTAIIEAHLASNTREEFAAQLFEYLSDPAVYPTKNPTRHALACKWLKNATSHIFPETNQLFTELVINACDASLDQIYGTGKHGIGFFSIFKLFLTQETNPTIILETTYRDSHDELKSYSITFEMIPAFDSSLEIATTFDFSSQTNNLQTGTTIRIKPKDKNFSPKTCESIHKQLSKSLRFYEHLLILSTLHQGTLPKQTFPINLKSQVNKQVSILISPESIIIQDSGTGISLWNALQHLLIPSSSSKNYRNVQNPETVVAPVTAQPLDASKRISHFFMTANGVTLISKKLPHPIVDPLGNSVDLHISLPPQMQSTLAHNEIVINPDGTSFEEAYLKRMITLTIDQAINGSIENQHIIYALYQGLEQWEQQSAQSHIQGLFSRFLQDELNKKLQTNKALACPLEFLNLFNRHFKEGIANVIPVHPSLVFNNYEPLEQYLKKIGHNRLATPTKNQKKALQNKAAGGGLIFGMNVFFLPNISEISHYGLRSCIFAPEEMFFKNNTIPEEQELINQLILALPEKHHRQTSLAQARDTIHFTPEQQYLFTCFSQQYEHLFKRFNIEPQALINPANFSYSWIENFTRPLDALIPNRRQLTTKMLLDAFNLNLLTQITHTFEALPYLKDAFKTLQGTSYGGYQQLFSFSSNNLPFCYGTTSTQISTSINNNDPVNTISSTAPLIDTLTQNWNQDNKQYLEKIMYLQMQDFAQKTAEPYRNQSLAELKLFVPSGIHGTPLHLLGILAKRLKYSPNVIELIKVILNLVQTPEQLAVIVVTLAACDLSLIHYACSPDGLQSLTSIIQHYIQKKVDLLTMKKIYCSLHLINCNELSALQQQADNELLCTSIKTMLEKSARGNKTIPLSQSTLPQELSHIQKVSCDQSFFLSQLFKAHCQEQDFRAILEQEDLDSIIGLIEKFRPGKLNKIEQCIAGSEKNPIEESILECLQNATDASREFYQNYKRIIDDNTAGILATIDMEISHLQKTGTHQSLQFSIHDQAGFPSLKTLLTHFVLPDLSYKSSSHGSVGEMGNGSFKMYQKAEIVQVLTRTTSNQNRCYLLTIEPQRSSQNGLVEDLKLTCQNVSSITPSSFRGTSIKITFEEESIQTSQITAGQINDFLHGCISSTTAHLNEQHQFNIVLHEDNTNINLNDSSSKNLIYQYLNDKKEVLVKIFKRPNQNLQSFVSTAGIPFCPFDVFAREQNVLPDNLIHQLEKGYIIDFQLGTYKPVQSRTKIQLTINKQNLRKLFLDLFYIHGLNQAIEEKNLLLQNKISLQQSCLSSRFTHFASQCNIFQLFPSELDERAFNQGIQNYLESGIWETNLLEAKFFDFYFFQAETNKSFSCYLHEIKKIISKEKKTFHKKMITTFTQSNQDLLTSTHDQSILKNKLENSIKQSLETDSLKTNTEWFHLHSIAIEFWAKEMINKLDKKVYDNPQRGLFVDIIVAWLGFKLHPQMYQFNIEFYAKWYAEKIISQLTAQPLGTNKASSTALNAATQKSHAQLLNDFFEKIHTQFCQDFLDAIHAVQSKGPISCKIVKSLNENLLGNYNPDKNELKLNADYINFLGLIEFIQLVNRFDAQANPVQEIYVNHFFNSFYWPHVGNIPTLIHELEHARRACYLKQYPGSSGCESHNDGYDAKNNFVTFDACAHSWAEEAFKNNLLSKLITKIQEAMKNAPIVATMITHIAVNPHSEANKKILHELGKNLQLGHTSNVVPTMHVAQPQKPKQENIFDFFKLHNVSQNFDLGAFLTVHNINEQDENGCTILHYAVENSDCQLAYAIINAGANTNIQNKDGDTPLHVAYKKRKYEIPHDIINLLVSSGACLMIHNNEGETPLHCGIKKNADIPVEILKNITSIDLSNSKNRKTILNEALSLPILENTLLIELLLNLNADASIDDLEGNLPLHYAAHHRSISVLEKVLNKNPNLINARNKKGQTPLFFALQSQSIERIELLLNRGADKNISDHENNNIMHQLLSLKPFPSGKFIQAFIKKIEPNCSKKLLNSINIHGELPIHMVPGDIPTTTLKSLIQKMSNVITQDKDGNTLLHKILIDTRSFNKTMVQKNIEYLLGLNPKKMPSHALSIRNGYGFTPYQCTHIPELKKLLQEKKPERIHLDEDATNTPLHWAAENGLTQHIRVHIQTGNYAANTLHNGMTALHLACYRGHLEVIKTLIELGSNSNEQDAWGHTSLHWAVLGEHTAVIEYLLAHNPALYFTKDNFGKMAIDLTQNQVVINILEKNKPTSNFLNIRHLI